MAFNQGVTSRIEQDVTRTSNTVFNQHLMIESKETKKHDLEQGCFSLKLFKQTLLGSEQLAEFRMDLLTV